MLLVLSLISVTALRVTRLEERMAGNNQDRNLAFQAAEAALREGEAFLQNPALPAFNGTNGLYRYLDGSPPAPSAFSAGNSRSYVQPLPGVAEQPRYIIEQMPPGPSASESLVIGVTYGAPTRIVYRITAVGYGGSAAENGTPTTRVTLQTSFKR